MESPIQNQAPAGPTPHKETAVGPVIAIIVIILILIAGGAYYILQTAPTLSESATLPTAEDVAASQDPDVQAALSQGTSDNLADIEADLNATNMGAVDTAISGLQLQ
jgi:uncharacterized protein HemX